MDEANLIVGRFYWVMPVIDVDSEADWEADTQPARYAGKNDRGENLWNCLGIDGASNWPMRWIGDEVGAQREAGWRKG